MNGLLEKHWNLISLDYSIPNCIHESTSKIHYHPIKNSWMGEDARFDAISKRISALLKGRAGKEQGVFWSRAPDVSNVSAKRYPQLDIYLACLHAILRINFNKAERSNLINFLPANSIPSPLLGNQLQANERTNERTSRPTSQIFLFLRFGNYRFQTLETFRFNDHAFQHFRFKFSTIDSSRGFSLNLEYFYRDLDIRME